MDRTKERQKGKKKKTFFHFDKIWDNIILYVYIFNLQNFIALPPYETVDFSRVRIF